MDACLVPTTVAVMVQESARQWAARSAGRLAQACGACSVDEWEHASCIVAKSSVCPSGPMSAVGWE